LLLKLVLHVHPDLIGVGVLIIIFLVLLLVLFIFFIVIMLPILLVNLGDVRPAGVIDFTTSIIIRVINLRTFILVFFLFVTHILLKLVLFDRL
jgi:hypothetical protein